VGAAVAATGDSGEVQVTIDVSLRHDAEANAAAITFDASARGRSLRTYAVASDDGTVLATVTFDSAGRLVQIELLDASRQIPIGLR
jgi:hypothetical protein